jgi:hypothetical protein
MRSSRREERGAASVEIMRWPLNSSIVNWIGVEEESERAKEGVVFSVVIVGRRGGPRWRRVAGTEGRRTTQREAGTNGSTTNAGPQQRRRGGGAQEDRINNCDEREEMDGGEEAVARDKKEGGLDGGGGVDVDVGVSRCRDSPWWSREGLSATCRSRTVLSTVQYLA